MTLKNYGSRSTENRPDYVCGVLRQDTQCLITNYFLKLYKLHRLDDEQKNTELLFTTSDS